MISPSTIISSTPVTVIVWGIFQLPALKVSCDKSTVPSVKSLLATSTTTT